MTKLEWKSGDTAPTRRLQLAGRDGNPPDLTGIQDVVGHVDGHPDALDVAVDGDASDGIVRVDRGTVPPGTYQAEIQVTFADGTVQTFPDGKGDGDSAYLQVRVWPDLDPPAGS